MKLPAELIVLDRPELPVDILSIVEGRLVALVYEESVLQSLVCPLLLIIVYLYLGDILDVSCDDSFTCLEIVQKFGSGSLLVTGTVQSLYFFKSGMIQVQQVEHLRFELRCLCRCRKSEYGSAECSKYFSHITDSYTRFP